MVVSVFHAVPAHADGSLGEALFQKKRLSQPEAYPPQEMMDMFGLTPSQGWIEGAKEAGEDLNDELQERLATASSKVDTLLTSHPNTCTEMPSDTHIHYYNCSLPIEILRELGLSDYIGSKTYSQEDINTLEKAKAAYKADLAMKIAQKDSTITKAMKPIAMSGIKKQILKETQNGQPFYYGPSGETHVLYLLQTYDSTLSLPLTKMVMGNLKISVQDINNFAKAIYDSTIDPKIKKDQMQQIETNEQLESEYKTTQKNIDNAVKAFDFMMTSFPLLLLTVVFFLQVLSHVFGKAFGLQEAQGVRALFHAMRYMAFMVIIIFYKPVFMWVTDMFNLMSISIASAVEQSKVQATMTTQLGAFASTSNIGQLGQTVASFVNWICSWIVQCALILIFMGRDIMLAFSAILGPTCIALGYYKNMTGKSNALGEYLSGWFGGYLRLMVWGIVTAILITTLGLYCTMGFSVNPSGLAMMIMSCIFAFTAASIPKYSDTLSNIAMASLLTAVPASGLSFTSAGAKRVFVDEIGGRTWTYVKSKFGYGEKEEGEGKTGDGHTAHSAPHTMGGGETKNKSSGGPSEGDMPRPTYKSKT